MRKFLTNQLLADSLYKLMWEARERLFIISPFIHLNDYSVKILNDHFKNPDLELLLVFGKNETHPEKSLSRREIEYFKEFPNICICYSSNLHAKFYANEKKGLITSLYLNKYSIDNNIEFGMLLHSENTEEIDAWNCSMNIINQSDIVYLKRPVFKSKNVEGIVIKSYIESKILVNRSLRFYMGKSLQDSKVKNYDFYPRELDFEDQMKAMPARTQNDSGYCIRCNSKIPYNHFAPLCKSCFAVWKDYKNRDYQEKYCHRTGRPSKGRTSMKKPEL